MFTFAFAAMLVRGVAGDVRLLQSLVPCDVIRQSFPLPAMCPTCVIYAAAAGSCVSLPFLGTGH